MDSERRYLLAIITGIYNCIAFCIANSCYCSHFIYCTSVYNIINAVQESHCLIPAMYWQYKSCTLQSSTLVESLHTICELLDTIFVNTVLNGHLIVLKIAQRVYHCFDHTIQCTRLYIYGLSFISISLFMCIHPLVIQLIPDLYNWFW